MEKSQKKLYLITNKFPYGNDTGEMYLNYEINYLCKVFDEVNVISCTGKESDGISLKNMPKNSKIILLKDNKNKLYYVINSFKLLFKKKSKEYIEELKTNNNLFKRIFLGYFLARADSRLKKLIDSNILSNINEKDIIYIYSYRLFDFAYIAIKLKEKYLQKNKIKLISRAHRYDLYEESNKFNYLPMRKFLLSNLDNIYPCSMNGQIYLTTKFPEFCSKIKCIYLGSIDFGYKIQNKKNSNKMTIVSCSNINKVKRVNFIADVIEKLYKKIDVKWIHIGGDEKSIKNITKKHINLVNKGIINFEGNLNHSNVIDFYKHNYIDLFINLSESEGVPQSIMEAISYGIPSIATNVGGTSEIVKDNISGFLVEKNDSDKIICDKIISYYMMSYKDKLELRKKTRKYWEENFNVNANIERFIEEIM